MIAVTAMHSGSPGAGAAGEPSGAASSAAVTSGAPASSAAAASSGGTRGGAVPGPFLGHWKGTLADNTGLEGPQAADLMITGGAVNSAVGTVSYPNVGCTYEFRLVSAQPAQVTFYEQVQSGLCQSEYVVLAPAGSGITENVYPGPPSGGRPDFSGQLSRAWLTARAGAGARPASLARRPRDGEAARPASEPFAGSYTAAGARLLSGPA